MDEKKTDEQQGDAPAQVAAESVASLQGEQACKQEQHQDKSPKEYFWNRWDIQDILTMFLAVFAFVSSFAAIWQGCMTRTVLNHTIEKDRLDQRAWVGPIYPFSGDIKVGEKMDFGFGVMNSGKTPALKITAQAAVNSVLKGQKFSPSYPKEEEVRGVSVLYPGAVSNLFAISKEFTQQDIEDFRGGKRIIYMFGKLSYNDIFGQPHCSTFCVFFKPDFRTVRDCDTYNDVADYRCD